MLNKIESIVSFLNQKIPFTPEVGIILGTGLGGLIQEIDIKYILLTKIFLIFQFLLLKAILES